jgi:hypothetical protein
VYGATKLGWALGGELLMRQTPLSHGQLADMLAREPPYVVSHWAGVAMALAGVGVALATTRRGRLPRLLTTWLSAAIGGFMVLRASYGAAGDLAMLAGLVDGPASIARWDLLLWSPLFGLWGAAWLRAAGVSSIRSATRSASSRDMRADRRPPIRVERRGRAH